MFVASLSGTTVSTGTGITCTPTYCSAPGGLGALFATLQDTANKVGSMLRPPPYPLTPNGRIDAGTARVITMIAAAYPLYFAQLARSAPYGFTFDFIAHNASTIVQILTAIATNAAPPPIRQITTIAINPSNTTTTTQPPPPLPFCIDVGCHDGAILCGGPHGPCTCPQGNGTVVQCQPGGVQTSPPPPPPACPDGQTLDPSSGLCVVADVTSSTQATSDGSSSSDDTTTSSGSGAQPPGLIQPPIDVPVVPMPPIQLPSAQPQTAFQEILSRPGVKTGIIAVGLAALGITAALVYRARSA